jgi:Type IV secretion system pilin
MKKKLGVLSGIVLGSAPLMALAQNSQGCLSGQAIQSGTIQNIICKIGNILDTIIPILIVLGVVYFVWGVVQYVISGDEEAKAKGKTHMIYGIIGLVVIVAMWGLVGIVTNTFGLNGTSNITVPTVPFNQ